AEVVGEDERLGVRDAEHRAEGEDRLVLGHLRLRAGELTVGDRVLLAAGHRTLETGRVAVVIVKLHLLAADGPRLRERLLAQVVGAETAERVDRADEERRAEGRQRLGPGLERLARLLDER